MQQHPHHSKSVLTFEEAVAHFLAAHDTLFFVQVGGLGGIRLDPLRPFIDTEKKLSGLVIEPRPDRFDALHNLYSNSERIKICRDAVDAEHGEKTIWRFMPSAIERGLLDPLFSNICSPTMENLLKEDGAIGRLFNEQQRAHLKTLIEPVTMSCRTMKEILEAYDISRVDLLQIDTGGDDRTTLESFDFAHFLPEIVHYQPVHLCEEDQTIAERILTSLRYTIYRHERTVLAIRGMHPVLRVAYFLQRDQRLEDALTLYRHILFTEPNNIDALHGTAIALDAKGSVEEMLDILIKIKARSSDTNDYNQTVEMLAMPSVHVYNTCLHTGDLERAARIIEALQLIYPDNVFVLENALMFFSRMDRPEQAIRVARRLFERDPTHTVAYQKMADFCRQPSFIQNEIEMCIARVHQTQKNTHTALRLQTIYDALSAVLFSDINDSTLAFMNALMTLARTIVSECPVLESDGVYHGYMFYRAIFDTLNIQTITQPIPTPAPWPTIGFSSSTGQTMDILAVRAMAAKQKANVVFFAAADPVYIARHARRYISSLLKFCDTRFLIVLHVIGGIDRLDTLASVVGIEEDRLVFSADAFNPETIQRTTFNIGSTTSTRDLSRVVYYQSARFLWLGYMMEQLALPIIVSDIDQWLQRGIQDMLDRFANTDVVFHEALNNTKMTDRLIANLLLVNPTDTGMIFARFIRYYLDLALQHAEKKGVGAYFFDQIALLMARHHVSWVTTPRFGYFDQFDINLGMYGTYEENPFRFFSLYSGFDLDAQPVGEAS